MKNKNSPFDWQEVKLGDEEYFKIIGSGINKFQGERDYLSTESIKGTKIKKIECKITYDDRPSRANMQPFLNTVWFAKMKSTIKVYYFSNKNKEEIDKYILSTGFAGIKFDSNISPDYIRFFFLTKMFNEEKDKFSTGSTQSGINNSFISRIKIPLPFSNGTPDLEEQERIVQILEKAEKQKERGKNTNYLLDEYLKSIFYEMFYNKGFEEKALKEIVSKDENSLKRGPFGGSLKKDIFVNEGYLVYEQRHAIHDDFKYAKYYITKEKYEEMKMFEIVPGDFIVSCSGVTLGRIAEIPKSAKPGIINQALLKISLDHKKVNNEYFKFLFRKEPTQKKLFGFSRGSGIPNFPSMLEVKKVRFPIPPLPLQQKFASIVERVEKMKETIGKTNARSEVLFNSLMHKAFSGEL